MGNTRNTKQKQLILDVLNKTGKPMTAGEIYERAVKIQPGIAKSTVYRNLDTLLSRGEVLHGWLENGESFYSAIQGHEHKHFMICKGCNRMVDLPECPLGNLEREIAKTSGFTVTDHVIQIYGYCNECSKHNK